MALINCPECGKQISDKAAQCIHCGAPIVKPSINVISSNQSVSTLKPVKKESITEKMKQVYYKRPIITISSVVGVVALVVFICVLIANSGNHTQKNLVELPEKVQMPVLDSIKIDWVFNSTYTVGKELTLDSVGRIKELSTIHETTEFSYSDNGLLEKVTVTQKDDGKVGYESWKYDENKPVSSVYEPNSFRSSNKTVYTTKTDENGRVSEISANITLKDSEDGSTSKRKDKFIFSYDENGRVSSYKYYTKNKLDHTAFLSYDDHGNITVFSCKGSGGKEYLRIELSYKMVDSASEDALKVDAFNQIFNWEKTVEYLL